MLAARPRRAGTYVAHSSAIDLLIVACCVNDQAVKAIFSVLHVRCAPLVHRIAICIR